MNYIKLLNAVYGEFYDDDRLNATHVSLYMALFQEWNFSRFAKEFFINRNDIMLASKIASKTSYHRCLVELREWGYIQYFPSRNPYKSSKVSMIIFETEDQPTRGDYDPILEQVEEEFNTGNGQAEKDQCSHTGQAEEEHRQCSGPVVDSQQSGNGQVEVPPINGNKQANNIKLPNDSQAVLKFFKKKGFDADEGKKFLDYYRDRNWKTSDGKMVRDWKAVARSWMERDFKQSRKKALQSGDNLKTKKTKNYDQPL